MLTGLLSKLLGSDVTEESAREVLGHAVIGSLITLSVAIFDIVAGHWDHWLSRLGAWKFVLGAVGLLLLLFSVFVAIYHFERLLKRLISTKPRILTFGDVRGTWVNTIVKECKRWQCSKLKIDSSLAGGFQIEGQSYDVINEFEVAKRVGGSFKSLTSTFGPASIAYVYEGTLKPEKGDPEQKHHGVVYYEFYKGMFQDEPRICFKGAFVSHRIDSAFHMIGIQVSQKGGDDSHWRSVMEVWVKSDEVLAYMKEIKPLEAAAAATLPVI